MNLRLCSHLLCTNRMLLAKPHNIRKPVNYYMRLCLLHANQTFGCRNIDLGWHPCFAILALHFRQGLSWAGCTHGCPLNSSKCLGWVCIFDFSWVLGVHGYGNFGIMSLRVIFYLTTRCLTRFFFSR